MSKELQTVHTGTSSIEDWYLEADGRRVGYLYRSTNGWAVAVDLPGWSAGPFAVAPSKDAALAFAECCLQLEGLHLIDQVESSDPIQITPAEMGMP